MVNPTEPTRIVVPTTFDCEITIKLNTQTGQTELRCNKPLNQLALAGVLAEHSTSLIRQMIANSNTVIKGV